MRVEREKLRRALCARGRSQIHRHRLPVDCLEVKCDARAVGRGAAEVVVELHAATRSADTMVLRSSSSPSMPPSSRSPGFTGPTPAGLPGEMMLAGFRA